MRSIFGVLSLLLALVIVGVVVKKQLAAPQASANLAGQAAPAPLAPLAPSPQQTQQQFKQALDAALQSAQPLKDRAIDEK